MAISNRQCLKLINQTLRDSVKIVQNYLKKTQKPWDSYLHPLPENKETLIPKMRKAYEKMKKLKTLTKKYKE